MYLELPVRSREDSGMFQSDVMRSCGYSHPDNFIHLFNTYREDRYVFRNVTPTLVYLGTTVLNTIRSLLVADYCMRVRTRRLSHTTDRTPYFFGPLVLLDSLCYTLGCITPSAAHFLENAVALRIHFGVINTVLHNREDCNGARNFIVEVRRRKTE